MSESLKITADDGHAFDLTVFAAADARAPVLLIGPAMGTPARIYTPLAEAFAAQGINVGVIELRGIGSSSLRASKCVDYGYRHLVEQDWVAACAALRARFVGAPLFLFGHSLGGHVSLLSAARHPDGIAGAIIVAAGTVHYQGWSGAKRYGYLAFTQFAGAVSRVVGYYPGKRLGFGGTEAKTLMGDWSRLGRTGRFTLRGGADYEVAMANVQLPVLGISFEHDGFAPHRAQKLLLDKLRAASVTQHALSAADVGMRLDHYNWIKQSDAVVSRVVAFVKSAGASS